MRSGPYKRAWHETPGVSVNLAPRQAVKPVGARVGAASHAARSLCIGVGQGLAVLVERV